MDTDMIKHQASAGKSNVRYLLGLRQGKYEALGQPKPSDKASRRWTTRLNTRNQKPHADFSKTCRSSGKSM